MFYWVLLFGSLGFALISIFLGDILNGLMDGLSDFFNPLLLFGTLSIVGGTGVLLTKYSSLQSLIILLISVLIGILAYFLIYHFMVIPLSNAEASTSISIKDLEGAIAEVITTIPAVGMGEVFIKSKNGSRSETAKSFDHVEIKQGTKVVVVHVDEQILYVSKINEF